MFVRILTWNVQKHAIIANTRAVVVNIIIAESNAWNNLLFALRWKL